MLKPVSPIFHGRDVFTPAAAHLANGVTMEEFGPKIELKNLAKAPYEEAEIRQNNIKAMVININRFGNVFPNIIYKDLQEKWKLKFGDKVTIIATMYEIDAVFARTFGEVRPGEPAMIPDDFGRVEFALNQKNFAGRYGIKKGERIDIKRA